MNSKTLLNILIVSSNTLLSRVLGMGRDIILAFAMGSNAITDAYLFAFRFANLFRRIFGEGSFNSAFIPLYNQKMVSEGSAAANEFAQDAQNGLLFVLLIFTAIVELSMPWLLHYIAPGFSGSSEIYDLALDFCRIVFPYLVSMSLMALLTGVLNSIGKFGVAAFAPTLLNVFMIGALGIVHFMDMKGSREAGYVLSWVASISGVAQFLVVYVSLRRRGVHLRFGWPRWSDEIATFLRRGLPNTISSSVVQINIFISSFFATSVVGGVSVLYYADRLIQLPLGLVGVAIGVVILPSLSRSFEAGHHDEGTDTLNRSLELAMLITLPFAAALTIAAVPIVTVFYQRGAFTVEDMNSTVIVLRAFAWGMPAFVLTRVLQQGFYAKGETKLPMYFSMVSTLTFVTATVTLFPLWSIEAIGHANSLAGWASALLLAIALFVKYGIKVDARCLRGLCNIILATVTMTWVLWWTLEWLLGYIHSGSWYIRFGILGLYGFLGAGVYFFTIFLLDYRFYVRHWRSFKARRKGAKTV